MLAPKRNCYPMWPGRESCCWIQLEAVLTTNSSCKFFEVPFELNLSERLTLRLTFVSRSEAQISKDSKTEFNIGLLSQFRAFGLASE